MLTPHVWLDVVRPDRVRQSTLGFEDDTETTDVENPREVEALMSGGSSTSVEKSGSSERSVESNRSVASCDGVSSGGGADSGGSRDSSNESPASRVSPLCDTAKTRRKGRNGARRGESSSSSVGSKSRSPFVGNVADASGASGSGVGGIASSRVRRKVAPTSFVPKKKSDEENSDDDGDFVCSDDESDVVPENLGL